ncbi:MAG: cyclic nucleotide-binding domain-containing protein [Sedimentisphaerales bacterium]|nr:cyclic nucleotide-binding domain-containing protein [Sedimentisphaerales bacterium]
MTPRIITEFAIELTRQGTKVIDGVKPVNLSEKGLCVQLGSELAQDELLNVFIQLGAKQDSLSASVKVVWRRYDKPLNIWFYGLGFVGLSTEQRQLIQDYVQQGAVWLLEFLSEFPLFSDFSRQDCQELLHIITLRDLSRHEVLYRSGAVDADLHGLFIVHSGLMNIYKGSEPEPQKQLAVVSAGQVFGESSLVSDQPHSATLAAVNDTRLIQLSKAGFNALKRKDPQLGLKVMEVVARTLVSRLGRTTNLLFRSL